MDNGLSRCVRIALLMLVMQTAASAQSGGTYHFDEHGGSIVIDSSGGGNNGTIEGASYVPGYQNDALRFRKNQNDVVRLPASVFSGFSSKIYVEMMVRTNSAVDQGPGCSYVLFQNQRNGAAQEVMGLTSSNRLFCLHGGISTFSTSAVPIGSYAKVGCYYDGQAIRAYINDLEVGRQNGVSTTTPGNATFIGNYLPHDNSCGARISYDGDIDEVRIAPGKADASCSLSCSINGPFPVVDTSPLTLRANATATNTCSGTPAYEWYFDGVRDPSTAKDLSTSFSPGAHTYAMRATQNGNACATTPQELFVVNRLLGGFLTVIPIEQRTQSLKAVLPLLIAAAVDAGMSAWGRILLPSYDLLDKIDGYSYAIIGLSVRDQSAKGALEPNSLYGQQAIDLEVRDPSGRVVNEATSSIPNAVYLRAPFLKDQPPVALVLLKDPPLPGSYTVKVRRGPDFFASDKLYLLSAKMTPAATSPRVLARDARFDSTGELTVTSDFSSHTSLCAPNETTMCLGGGRFRVQTSWRDFSNAVGVGKVVTGGTSDSGLFWFFASTNWEVLVKVLNGCGVNNRFWVFGAATTNVEYAITVTDTQTGASNRYTNRLGVAAPAITDTNSFVCP